MKVFLCLGFLLCFYLGSEAKVLSRCELKKILKKAGLDGYRGYSAANWMCLAYHVSNYNTTAVNNNGPSRDYGIFQINSQLWCNDGKTLGAVNACQINCQSLLNDDINDDIECSKRVVRDPNGISACVNVQFSLS
ncbi:lysozyme C-2-like isoform X2 [Phyllobates terribilis]|uniref:lysozyme C-2-like isoform X2 n=1 Tax=Phyllobates terribilis TaxID=111132 RepID=UPI003CCAE1D9